MTEAVFPILDPSLQVSFYYRLQTIRDLHFQDALSETVKNLELPRLDNELNSLVDGAVLRRVASFSLRGEWVFPVPF